jgi:hypothetical protein
MLNYELKSSGVIFIFTVMKMARRKDYCLPMPDHHVMLGTDERFTREEFTKMKYGLMPGSMDDKWHIFFENGSLYFYRSWTGFLIYEALFEEKADGSSCLRELWVNCDPSQYGYSGAENEVAKFLRLVDTLLLDKHG